MAFWGRKGEFLAPTNEKTTSLRPSVKTENDELTSRRVITANASQHRYVTTASTHALSHIEREQDVSRRKRDLREQQLDEPSERDRGAEGRGQRAGREHDSRLEPAHETVEQSEGLGGSHEKRVEGESVVVLKEGGSVQIRREQESELEHSVQIPQQEERGLLRRHSSPSSQVKNSQRSDGGEKDTNSSGRDRVVGCPHNKAVTCTFLPRMHDAAAFT